MGEANDTLNVEEARSLQGALIVQIWGCHRLERNAREMRERSHLRGRDQVTR